MRRPRDCAGSRQRGGVVAQVGGSGSRPRSSTIATRRAASVRGHRHGRRAWSHPSDPRRRSGRAARRSSRHRPCAGACAYHSQSPPRLDQRSRAGESGGGQSYGRVSREHADTEHVRHQHHAVRQQRTSRRGVVAGSPAQARRGADRGVSRRQWQWRGVHVDQRRSRPHPADRQGGTGGKGAISGNGCRAPQRRRDDPPCAAGRRDRRRGDADLFARPGSRQPSA